MKYSFLHMDIVETAKKEFRLRSTFEVVLSKVLTMCPKLTTDWLFSLTPCAKLTADWLVVGHRLS